MLNDKEAIDIIKKWCRDKPPDEPIMKNKHIGKRK